MSKSPPRPPCHSPVLSRETASVCVSARGWGGIFMPLKRLTLLLNNCSNLLSQVVTLCSPWPAEQPSSEVQNMKAGEGRSRGGKRSSPWKRLPKATRNKSRCARPSPPRLGRAFLGSLSEPAAASPELSESTDSTFPSLHSVLLCFAAQPCLHKRCWKLIPPEFQ